MTLPPVLRNRDVRLFSSGQCLSVAGSEITTVAMAWQVYQLTDSPLDIGLIGLARAIPQMALLLYGGLLADAFDRRRLMMVLQGVQFAASGVLCLLTALGWITPLMLFLSSGVFGVCTALETPSRQAIIPNLVEREEITSALALQNALRKIGSVAGPALGGIVLSFTSPAWCYAFNGAAWLAMLRVLALVRLRSEEAVRRSGMSLSSLADGLRFVATHPVILTLMALDFGANLFGLPNALFPVYARDILEVGAAGLGVLYAATSLGAIAGGVVMSTLTRVPPPGLGVLGGVAVYGLANACFAVSRDLWLSALLLAVAGVGNAVSAVLRWTIVQTLTPDAMRGRVSAAGSIFTSGGPRLGEFRGGAVAQVWGAEVSAFSGALATAALAGGVALLPFVRRFQLEQDGPVTAPRRRP